MRPLDKFKGSGLITLYKKAVGLNNKVSPHRLAFTADGVSALEEATDVIIDPTGEIVTRRSNVLLDNRPWHSLWKTDGGFFGVTDRATDSALYKLSVNNADGTVVFTGLRSGLMKGAKLSYTRPLGGKIYYSNGYENGMIVNSASEDWTESEWTASDTTADMVKAPIGTHLDILSGVVLIAVGDELFSTVYGHPGIVNNVLDRVRFETDIIMVCAVQTGVFVSDLTSIYFLAGANPREWTLNKVCNYPAKSHGKNQDLVDPSFLGLETNKMSGLFATANGPVIGLPDGSIINLIDKQVSLPQEGCLSGSIMVVDETTIIQSGE
jgi:hypothetical protein